MKSSTQEVLDILITDSILEIEYRKRISKDILERIVLVYLSFFTDKNYLEYEELSAYEKNIRQHIIMCYVIYDLLFYYYYITF